MQLKTAAFPHDVLPSSRMKTRPPTHSSSTGLDASHSQLEADRRRSSVARESYGALRVGAGKRIDKEARARKEKEAQEEDEKGG